MRGIKRFLVLALALLVVILLRQTGPASGVLEAGSPAGRAEPLAPVPAPSDDASPAPSPEQLLPGEDEEAGSPREGSAGLPTPLPAVGESASRPARATANGVLKMGFDATSVLRGSLLMDTPAPDDGSAGSSEAHSPARAAVTGGGQNAYARGQWQVVWWPGTVFRTEADFFLPPSFYADQMGAVHLLGWDTWPVSGNQMRLEVWHTDHQARLFLKREGRDTVLTNPFNIPEGRWVQIAVEQKISETDGWSRVYLDGTLVAEGQGVTATTHAVTRMRYGLVGIDAGRQRRPLVLYFDRVRLRVLEG